MTRAQPPKRDDYRVWRLITTRLMDNDVYGHVNNVVYYSWFDTAVNAFLMAQGALDMVRGQTIGLVVETQCQYHAPLSFPEPIEVGLRLEHLGTSSVRYGLAVFATGHAVAAAHGHFVHVYVDRTTRRPVPLPASLTAALQLLQPW